MTRRAFVSYAREDSARVSEVEGRLRRLDLDVWADQALRGGQVWWDEILEKIRGCDVFVAIISAGSLNSQACSRERAYAEELGKLVVPVAVEPLHVPLPVDIASRQMVDFTPNSPDAAFALATALIGLPHTAALPDPLPPEPEMPLTYLSRLVEQAGFREDLPRSSQHEVLTSLEPGLRATDPEERLGAWHVLGILEARPDLAADAARRIDRLRDDYSDKEPPSVTDEPKAADVETVPSPGSESFREAEASVQAGTRAAAAALPEDSAPAAVEAVETEGEPFWRERWVPITVMVAAIGATIGAIIYATGGPGLELVAEGLAPGEVGSFTASGEAVEAGDVCGAGVTQDTSTKITRETDSFVELLLVKRFTCDDDSGTFDVEIDATVPIVDGERTEGDSGDGTWRIVSGTGDYADLSGSGDVTAVLVDTAQDGRVVDTFTGEASRSE